MRHTNTHELFATAAGISGPFLPDTGTLKILHSDWLRTIPFENIYVLLNKLVSTDVTDIADKLLRRGGHCFEHNQLFREVPEESMATGSCAGGVACPYVTSPGMISLLMMSRGRSATPQIPALPLHGNC